MESEMSEQSQIGKRKSPAFQFYADDFLAGTLDMSQEDVGAYIRLLCHQWSRGSIPVETEKQQRLAGGSISADVLLKFPVGDDGLRRNPRLEEEREKQMEFRQKQREKGLKSAETRKMLNHGSTAVPTTVQPDGQPGTQPTTQPDGQPEGNSPSPSPIYNTISGPKGRFAPPTKEELDLESAKIGLPSTEVDRFVDYYTSIGWKVGKNPMKSWRHALSGWASRWREKSIPIKPPAPPGKEWMNDPKDWRNAL
jgi:uncharacterized protein YdaU (DUF1376 family)